MLEPNQKAVKSIIVYRTNKRTFSICIFIFICIRHVRGKTTEDIVLIFFYFVPINPCLLSHFSQDSQNFEAKVFLEIQKQCFKIFVMMNDWEQSGFLPSPSCSSQYALLFVFITLCFAKMVTFLVRSRACSAVENKSSTLFGFSVHCKTRDLNISLDKLFIIYSSLQR